MAIQITIVEKNALVGSGTTANVHVIEGIFLSSVKTVNTRVGDVVITALDVGLDLVDNTSDANKPVSTAQQVALDTKLGNTIRGSLLDNPLCHLFKSNKLIETLAGVLTTNHATTSTYRDRYGVIKTAAINTLREEKDGWLIEGASTNLALHSEDFSNAIWSKVGSSVVADAFTAPDNTVTADKLIADGISTLRQTSISINGDITYSLFAKSGNVNNVIIAIFDITVSNGARQWFDVFNKTIGTSASVGAGISIKSSTIRELTNGWVKCEVTVSGFVSQQTTTLIYNSATDGNFDAPVGSFSYLWGAQLEELPFASSYIPTTTAAVTRAADIVNLVSTNNFTSTDFTIFLLGSTIEISGAYQTFISINDNALTNRVQLGDDLNGLAYSFYNTSSAIGFINTTAITRNKLNSYTITKSGSNIYFYLNNILISTNTNVTELLNITDIDIGSLLGNNENMYGHIKDLRVYDFVLNQQEVQYLSGV